METGRCVDLGLTRELCAHRRIGFGAPTANLSSHSLLRSSERYKAALCPRHWLACAPYKALTAMGTEPALSAPAPRRALLVRCASRCARPLPADRYLCGLPLLVKVIDEASFVGFLPDRQTWTRGTPSFKDFHIRARMWADPFKEVQDQRFYGVRHCYLRH
jgi:hypothetical protein